MDVSCCDHTSVSAIVDLKESTLSYQHSGITDNVSLTSQTESRTSDSGNIPITMPRAIYSRSVQNDSCSSNEIDVLSPATSIISITEGNRWCCSGVDTHAHGTGRPDLIPECTDYRQIFFNDTITTEDCRKSGKCHPQDTRDPGINVQPETTEILCDYASVCDEDNIYLEAVLPLACEDDQSQLLDNEVASCPETDRLTASTEHHRESNEARSSALCNQQWNGITNVSGTLVSERTCSEVTSVSTVAAMYITSLLNQQSKVSECLLPDNRNLFPEAHQPPPAVCVPAALFSPLVSTKLSELPPVSFPPIFYISIDETLPLNLCAAEKQNAVVKSELPNFNPRLAERCDSQLSAYSEKQDICRICHCEAEPDNKLISPCLCSGSLKYIHLCCLQKWIKSSDKKSCELCNFDYIMTMKIRPFKQWDRLDMTVAERRKIVCSVTFHIIAITCVIWSLYVLIDRTTEEVNAGTLDWPFWTKLIVVAIGFTGGLVFMYVQCKMYLQLCLRWRQFNKLINIENAPEDVHVRAEAAARIKARTHESGGVVNTVALQEVDSF